MSDFDAEIDWESASDRDPGCDVASTNEELDLSSPRTEVKRKVTARVSYSQSDIDAAIRRHKEDLAAAAHRLMSLAEVAADPLLQSLLVSALPVDITSKGTDIHSLHRLTATMSVFRTLGLRVSSSRHMAHRLSRQEESLGLVTVLVEKVFEIRQGSANHVTVLLLTCLTVAGFRARLVGSLYPRRARPGGSSTARKRLKSNDSSAGSGDRIADAVLVEPESGEGTDSDGDSGGEVVDRLWLEVYLQLPTTGDGKKKNGRNLPSGTSNGSVSTSNSSSSSNSSRNSSSSSSFSIRGGGRWVHVDYHRSLVDDPLGVEGALGRRKYVSYALAVDPCGRCTDVTARYTRQYSHVCQQYRLAGREAQWWQRFLEGSHTRSELKSAAVSPNERESEWQLRQEEAVDLRRAIASQTTVPHCGAAFRGHPVYLLERHMREDETVVVSYDSLARYPLMNRQEGLAGAGAVHSLFQGERVYLRSCVERLYTRGDWRRLMRSVRAEEADAPVKVLRRSVRRQRSAERSSGSNTIVDLKLYRFAQTEPLQVGSVSATGEIPTNSHGNVEVWGGEEQLVPRGAALVRGARAVGVAASLSLPHAPALFGFNRAGDTPVPQIGGVIVLQEHVDLLQEAMQNIEDNRVAVARQKMRARAVQGWRRLVSAAITRERLRSTYGA